MKEKLDYLKTIDTGILMDAMDALKLEGWMYDEILPMDPTSKIAGPAFTGQFRHVTDPTAPGHSSYDVIDMCDPGAVLVLAGGTGERVMGGNNATIGKMKQLAAIVADGMTRDIDEIVEKGCPLFCAGKRFFNTSPSLKLMELNVPVNCGGRLVRPGDIIFGDREGVIVIPVERLDDVIRQCKFIQSCEAEMKDIFAGKRPISEAKNIIKKKKIAQ
jgi:regulator of RNase E activity RraA